MLQAHQKEFNPSQLGDKWQVAENMSKEIEASTCIMHSYSKETSVNVVQRKILKKMIGEDNDLTKES